MEMQGRNGETHLEAILSGWHVDSTGECEVGELGRVVTLEEGQHRNDSGGVDQQLQLIPSSKLQ